MSEYIQGLRIVRELEPFLVVTPTNRRPLDAAPFGVRVPKRNVIDPMRMESEGFLALLQTLDGRTFGPEGMPMDRWVFYDCCYMPGAIFGFGRPAQTLSEHAREVLEVPDDYQGLVPYAMYIAIPMAPPGAWMGHNLASIAPILAEEELTGLGTLTKAMGLRCFRTKAFYGATQWSSKALYIHVKFGPLDLLTAWTPAHSEPRTLTYAFTVSERALLTAAGDPTAPFPKVVPEVWVDSEDTATMIALQDRIEAGERFVIAGPPRRQDGRIALPIAQAR